MPFAEEFRFRSRRWPFPPSRFERTAFLLLVSAFFVFVVGAILLNLWNTGFFTPDSGFPGFYILRILFVGAMLLMPLSIAFFALIAAIASTEAIQDIEYLEYSVTPDGISMNEIRAQGKEAKLWGLMTSISLSRSLKQHPSFAFKDIAAAEEEPHDGSRTLLVRERGFLTERGGAGLRVYLPDEGAEEIIAEIRRRIGEKAATR